MKAGGVMQCDQCLGHIYGRQVERFSVSSVWDMSMEGRWSDAMCPVIGTHLWFVCLLLICLRQGIISSPMLTLNLW